MKIEGDLKLKLKIDKEGNRDIVVEGKPKGKGKRGPIVALDKEGGSR